jgi:hypothetical protein
MPNGKTSSRATNARGRFRVLMAEHVLHGE